MPKILSNQNGNPAGEPIIIPDECGDSMWDAVIEQEIKVCNQNGRSENEVLPLKSIPAVQADGVTNTK